MCGIQSRKTSPSSVCGIHVTKNLSLEQVACVSVEAKRPLSLGFSIGVRFALVAQAICANCSSTDVELARGLIHTVKFLRFAFVAFIVDRRGNHWLGSFWRAALAVVIRRVRLFDLLRSR